MIGLFDYMNTKLEINELRKVPAIENGNDLVAIYDLEVSPLTFDVVSFLMMARLEMIDRGLQRLTIVVVFSCMGAYRDESDVHHFSDWRFRHIVLEALACLACDSTLLLFKERFEASRFLKEPIEAGLVFPTGYRLDEPIACYSTPEQVRTFRQRREVPSLRATEAALGFFKGWITAKSNGLRPVSISLRRSSHQVSRNSNIEAWVEVALWLRDRAYYPFFILDTETLYEPDERLENMPVFEPASFNIELRTAVYEACFLNLMINNGPSLLCYNNLSASYLYFKVLTEEYVPTQLSYFTNYELWPGNHWPHASRTQKFVWEDDRASVVKLAFAEMEARIEERTGTSLVETFVQLRSALSDGRVSEALDLSAVAIAFYEDDLTVRFLRFDALLAAGRKDEAYFTVYPMIKNKDGISAVIECGRLAAFAKLSIERADRITTGVLAEHVSRINGKTRKDFEKAIELSVELSEVLKLDTLLEDVNALPVLVFGAGQAGREFVVKYRDRYNIIAFVDNDEAKWGLLIDGIEVISPENIKRNEYCRICIVSLWETEIQKQLAQVEYPRLLIDAWYQSKGSASPCWNQKNARCVD